MVTVTDTLTTNYTKSQHQQTFTGNRRQLETLTNHCWLLLGDAGWWALVFPQVVCGREERWTHPQKVHPQVPKQGKQRVQRHQREQRSGLRRAPGDRTQLQPRRGNAQRHQRRHHGRRQSHGGATAPCQQVWGKKDAAVLEFLWNVSLCLYVIRSQSSVLVSSSISVRERRPQLYTYIMKQFMRMAPSSLAHLNENITKLPPKPL